MHQTTSCPKCNRLVSLPTGCDLSAIVRCPLCQLKYPLHEAQNYTPPLLQIVPMLPDEVDISHPTSDLAAWSAPVETNSPIVAAQNADELLFEPEADNSHPHSADESPEPAAEPTEMPKAPVFEPPLAPPISAFSQPPADVSSVGPDADEFGLAPMESLSHSAQPQTAEPPIDDWFSDSPAPQHESHLAAASHEIEPAMHVTEEAFETIAEDDHPTREKAESKEMLGLPPQSADLDEASNEWGANEEFAESSEPVDPFGEDDLGVEPEPEEEEFEMAAAMERVAPARAEVPAKAAAPAVKSKRSPPLEKGGSGIGKLVAAVVGLFFAVAIALPAYWWIMGSDPTGIAKSLPDFLSFALPQELKKKSVASVPNTNVVAQNANKPVSPADTEPKMPDDSAKDNNPPPTDSTPKDNGANPQDKPAENNPTDKPAPDKPTDPVVDKPGDANSEKPNEKPSDPPADKTPEKPADVPSDKNAEKPKENVAEKPTDPDLDKLFGPAPDKGKEKPAENPVDPFAEKPTPKPTDKANDDANSKPAADPFDVPKVPDPPATPELPPVVKAAPVGPKNAPKFTSAELSDSLKAVEASGKIYADALQSGDAAKEKGTRGDFLRKLYALSEKATFVSDGPEDPAIGEGKETAGKIVLQAGPSDKMVPMLGKNAAIWINHPSRNNQMGIVVAGVVTAIEKRDGLFATKLTLTGDIPDDKQKDYVIVSKAKLPKVSEAAPAIIFGAIIDNPTETIDGFTGTETRVIWSNFAISAKNKADASPDPFGAP